MSFARLLPAALLAVTSLLASTAAADTTSAKRATPKTATTDASEGQAFRAAWKNAFLYIPKNFHADNGTYDVVFHFHGMMTAQERNAEASNLNAVVVTLAYGIGSDPYSKAFQDPHAFDTLVATTEHFVKKSGRAPGATLGRIALSAWSAGFGSVGAILRNPAHRDRIDAVLLSDGLHSAYTDVARHVIDERSLVKYVRLAEDAIQGDKLFVITHSSIPTPGYASATEAVGTVLKLAGVDKEAAPTHAPRKMRPIYQVNRGSFHVVGFEGTGVNDHLDHIWAMGETMFPYLVERWRKTPAI